MIETLRIEELAIVELAELEFAPGLNVLTGETGAGKSIVLGALGLLAGDRASARQLREGAAETRVEGVFRTERIPELEAALEERGLVGDAHELVVQRSLGQTWIQVQESQLVVQARLTYSEYLAELRLSDFVRD